MGERQPTVSSFSFNRSIVVEGTDQYLSSTAGLLLVRELDERWGITDRLAGAIVDERQASRITWPMVVLLRARLLAITAGYSSQSEASALSADPIVRLTTSDRRGCTPLDETAEISQPTLARMHLQLGRAENLSALCSSLVDLGLRVIRHAAKAVAGPHTIDIDSVPIPSHGKQPGSVFNGYYREHCFHPLVAVHGETGTMLAATLRPGNSSSAAGAPDFMVDLLERVERDLGCKVRVRGDSSFANKDFLEALEARGTSYVFRVCSNSLLEELAEEHLAPWKGPRASEPRERLHSLTYSSRGWPQERRIILVVKETPGQLYLDHFFLVTNDWRSSPQTILDHYRKRGTSESRFGELKSRLEPKLSCTSTKGKAGREAAWHANEGTFQLYMLADGLLHALRWLARKEVSSDGESLPRLQRVQRLLIDVAARVTCSARRVHVHIAETANHAWTRLLWRLSRLRPVT